MCGNTPAVARRPRKELVALGILCGTVAFVVGRILIRMRLVEGGTSKLSCEVSVCEGADHVFCYRNI